MPITKQALKKLRRDRKKTVKNKKMREKVTKTVKKARKSPSAKLVSDAFRMVDKAAKKHHIHKNKAARLKSRLAKRLKK